MKARKMDSTGAEIFENKYSLNNEKTLDEFYARIFSIVNEYELKLYGIKTDFSPLINYFFPGGRTAFGLGRENVSLSNCYVNEIKGDSIEEIFETLKQTALIYKSGGGVGQSFNKLRPIGAKTRGVPSTGSISFMPLFDTTTDVIGQKGRRGANLGAQRVDHPDIMEFINVKNEEGILEHMNLSVMMLDNFMKAVEADEEWITSFTTSHETIVKPYRAKEIWDTIINSAWTKADPGILFWSQMTSGIDSTYKQFEPVCTNPCGEQGLENGGSCNLAALELSEYVENPWENPKFNFTKFISDIHLGIRFLDIILDINKDRHPLEINKIQSMLGRRIGLGIMGLADCYNRMNIVYGSEESLVFTEQLFSVLHEESIKASITYAEHFGAFPYFTQSSNEERINFLNHPYFNILTPEWKERLNKYGMRNISLTTVAPTGTTAMVMGVSSGLEPVFRNQYIRTIKMGGEKKDVIILHPNVSKYEEIFGEGSHKNNKIFIESQDINWVNRVKIQGIIQKHITQSISSTVNLPSTATREDIDIIYRTAWKEGLKGITVYRDGCREGVLNTLESGKEFSVKDHIILPDVQDSKKHVLRCYEIDGDNTSTELKKWYVHYDIDAETKLPCSLFVTTNSGTKEKTALTQQTTEKLFELANKYILPEISESLVKKMKHDGNTTKMARTLGMLLRHRVPIIEIINTIDQIGAPISSFIFNIKKLLSPYAEGKAVSTPCPECQANMVMEGGCIICKSCGYSKCG